MNLKKTFLLGAGAALLSANAFAENITVVSWGGALSEAQRKAYHEPFMKETGHTILEDEWAGEVSAIAAIVETGNYKWDIIVADTMTALSGCDQGVLEPIDLDMLGLTAADFIEGGLLECSVGDQPVGDSHGVPHGRLSHRRAEDLGGFLGHQEVPGQAGDEQVLLSRVRDRADG